LSGNTSNTYVGDYSFMSWLGHAMEIQ